MHYLDWEQVRKLQEDARRDALAPAARLAPEARKLAWLKVEMLWKHYVRSKRIDKALAASGLLPELAARHEAHHGAAPTSSPRAELESEATLSPCVAARRRWTRATTASPSSRRSPACPAGSSRRSTPPGRGRGACRCIALENDGNPYPPNVVSRIEIFAHNVSRGVRGDEPKNGKGFALKLGKYDWGHLQVPQELPKMPHLRTWARGFKYLPKAEEAPSMPPVIAAPDPASDSAPKSS